MLFANIKSKWGCDVKNKWCNRQPLGRWELEVLIFKLSSDKGNMWLITKVSLKILFSDAFCQSGWRECTRSIQKPSTPLLLVQNFNLSL